MTHRNLLAVLPRGEAIRNFVYSRALDHVAEHVPVRLATVIPNPTIRSMLEERFGPIEPLEEVPGRWLVGALRDTLDVAHGRWLWSEAAKERWRLRDQEATTLVSRCKLAAKRAAARPLATRAGLGLLDQVYEAATGRLEVGEAERLVLQRTEAGLVFNGSHIHSRVANGLLMAARRAGIPTAAFLFSWDNLTSQGRITPRYDSYLVWTDAIRQDLLRMYSAIDPGAVEVTGTPQFDFHFWPELMWTRAELAAAIGVDPERPIVLYSTGMPNHMPGEPDIVEDLADRLGRDPLGAQLVVRVYAKDRSGRFDALAARRSDICVPPVAWEANWLAPLPEDTALWSNLLRHADVGVNVASTVSLELCMFDVPIINIAYNPASVPVETIDYARYYRFDHYRPVTRSGAVDIVESAIDLEDAISRALKVPNQRADARRALLDRFFEGTLDGRSAERVAAALVRLSRAPEGAFR